MTIHTDPDYEFDNFPSRMFISGSGSSKTRLEDHDSEFVLRELVSNVRRIHLHLRSNLSLLTWRIVHGRFRSRDCC